jgi:CRISPR-associated endoribonuclease Cas6
MPRSPKPQKPRSINLTWPDTTKLLGLTLHLQPQKDLNLPQNYTVQLHSWFLDQVRRKDPTLSAYLHDSQSEKPFTISGLITSPHPDDRTLQLSPDQTYPWTITALSESVITWLKQWLQTPPLDITLRSGTFTINDWTLTLPPTTYRQLLPRTTPTSPTLILSFLTPTSFRRKGTHFPLPLPYNLFHSHLRRWNDFSNYPIDPDPFLNWIDESVIILRHELRSQKVSAGKSGSVTGFMGAVQYGLTPKAQRHSEFVKYFLALGKLAPYCGTGHKTTFGLGQTRSGWFIENPIVPPPSLDALLDHRIDELTEIFLNQRKRTGGDRALNIAQTWAIILARRELGDSLTAIAEDMEMPYETVKTYVKLARAALRNTNFPNPS